MRWSPAAGALQPAVEATAVHPQRRILLAINVVGGVAVLGSYAHGIATHPEPAAALWGGVPEGLRSPLYQVCMLLATAGYFAFTSYLLLRVDPDAARVGRFGFGLFHALYLGMLLPSALWMPLTFAWLDAPGPALWMAVRVVLFAVGIASLGLVVALLRLRPRGPRLHHALAVLGAVAFANQTAVLDALVWPHYFRE